MLCIPSIKANKLNYNLPNYKACVSVSLPWSKCKARTCHKCIIIRDICSFCFAWCAKNVFAYDMLALFSTNSFKCSPEQHTGSPVNTRQLWPHWQTYYCFFCFSCCCGYWGCFFSELDQCYNIMVHYGLRELEPDKMERWFFLQFSCSPGFSQPCFNKETTDKWPQSVAPWLSLDVFNR